MLVWNDLFPKDRQPEMDDIADYSGTFKPIWLDLLSYFETAYKCKPKMTYSGCSMPGWNLKFQKSGVSFGTWYPLPNAFDVMFIWSYKLDTEMQLLLPLLTPKTAELVKNAGDFMKNGRWFIFRADNAETVEDYKSMCAVKKAPAIVV